MNKNGLFFYGAVFIYAVFKLFLINWYTAESTDAVSYVNWDVIGQEKWLPLYPFLIECFNFVHPDPIIVGRLISIVFSILVLIPLFTITKEIFDYRAAWITFVLYCLMPIPLRWSLRVVTEPCFTLFLFLHFYYTYRYYQWPSVKNLNLIILFSFLAALTRPEAVVLFIVVLFWFYQHIKNKRKWGYFYITAVLILFWSVPLFWEEFVTDSVNYMNMNNKQIVAFIQGDMSHVLNHFYYYSVYGLFVNGFFCPILFVFSIVKIIKNKKQYELFWLKINGLWIAVLFFILFIHVGWSTRFLYSISVCVLPFVGFYLAQIKTKIYRYGIAGISAAACLILSGLVLFYQQDLLGDVKRMGQYIKENHPQATVYFNEPTLLPFYTTRKNKAYRVDELQLGDYVVFTNLYDIEKQLGLIHQKFNYSMVKETRSVTKPIFSDDIFIYSYLRADKTLAMGGNANVPIKDIDLLFKDSIGFCLLIKITSKK